ncbi:MAG: hypothetical protein ACR2JZ_00700, partial [Candidatus Limnocylindrales bacterium]
MGVPAAVGEPVGRPGGEALPPVPRDSDGGAEERPGVALVVEPAVGCGVGADVLGRMRVGKGVSMVGGGNRSVAVGVGSRIVWVGRQIEGVGRRVAGVGRRGAGVGRRVAGVGRQIEG